MNSAESLMNGGFGIGAIALPMNSLDRKVSVAPMMDYTDNRAFD
jgi:hypothetical protein